MIYPELVCRWARLMFRSPALGRLPGVWRIKHHFLDLKRVQFRRSLILTRIEIGDHPQIWIDPNDLIGRTIYFRGAWEAPVARRFLSMIRPGDHVLDIGANIGQYTLLASSAVGPEGRVYAVEASPQMAQRLKVNIEVNLFSNISVIEAAAWDRDEPLILRPGDFDNAGTASVAAPSSQSDGSSEGNAAVTIPGRRLDALLEALGCERIDLIKIDVEGAESRALAGLGRFLTARPPRAIFSEFTCDSTQPEQTAQSQALHRQLVAAGYTARLADNPEGQEFQPDATPTTTRQEAVVYLLSDGVNAASLPNPIDSRRT
ncbi:methyltransferase FkbM family [Isosphaera pallida ATCC 43644]|uniref:Methyltransferase FkbM family n=1 Tax=Isosphaera pallida (strain ATCC 43644 / DSM 9630 / IS1B) TaxID=575540 RepID=E8R5B4_ISOPI|nr:FkbM family methyltransferase [Isosphaera pallida]ADV63867.1 methyltransferase FkbM family [Isosphaera pallida ATCC 43644]